MRATFTIAVAAMVLSGPITPSLAQVQATGTWQLSSDNGLTWASGALSVPESQTSVRARLLFDWTPSTSSPPEYFGSALFDGTVTGVSGAGPNDEVSSLAVLQTGLYGAPSPILRGRRVSSSLIKIDQGDALPPGQGNYVVVSNSPITGTIVVGNPLQVLDYVLTLDGTLGSREISAVFATTFQPPISIISQLPPGYTVSASFQSATLTVVPAPAGLVTLAASGLVLARRRRC